MQQTVPVTVFWFRRDLRLTDNAGLYYALKEKTNVLPLFIFDTDILDKLEDKADKRVNFIYREIKNLHAELEKYGSSLLVKTGTPEKVWRQLTETYKIEAVYANGDYEPAAIQRDENTARLLKAHRIPFFLYKDHVIFEKYEILKEDGRPYTVFTPYSRKWKDKLAPFYYQPYPTLKYAGRLLKTPPLPLPTLKKIGFEETDADYPEKKIKSNIVKNYSQTRDYPALNGTSRLGLHLRFGTLSIRQLLAYALEKNETYVNELIWREFYQMILFHFPQVVNKAFKPEYDLITWENDEKKFAAWCAGKTGVPLVDAGMRELNQTSYMHNRVRMVVASYLTKNLLIDWRWGEAYFAQKLLDFELASNNGGWQWAAGCGTDAAPYFRVFNPTLQMQRFDPELKYVKRWVPEYGTSGYPNPIVDHAASRDRMLKTFKVALNTARK
jgi:deoxyribodipyrimidine photo-lyase